MPTDPKAVAQAVERLRTYYTEDLAPNHPYMHGPATRVGYPEDWEMKCADIRTVLEALEESLDDLGIIYQHLGVIPQDVVDVRELHCESLATQARKA